MTQVRICSSFDALYYSFYIQGIIDVFGESNMKYSYRNFPPFPSECLAFVVSGNAEQRVVIDAYDGARVTNHLGLEWCDVYGKVNLVSSILSSHQLVKCMPIGPSFPVQLWSSVIKACWMALKHYHPSARVKSSREHLANYVRQYRDRLPLKHFVPGPVKENYIFFSSTIWREDEAPGTNQYRASFMETCKSLEGVTFEGGFSPRQLSNEQKRYQEHIAPKRYPLPEWLKKIKSSAVVFNTPAVWLSHTWKLAEFLALGKAIISTPISRDLPAPLVHGQHIHYVDGSAGDIREAVLFILNNREYREHLEQNARDYYLTHLSPQRVIGKLLKPRIE
jgi:glycosyltransferase involved in cell wall biosynthesis